jgi:deoxyribose-phosphate aldolase
MMKAVDKRVNVESVVRKINAVLDEASINARTGRTAPGLGRMPEGDRLARIIEAPLLSATATDRDVELLCYEARLYEYYAVCLPSVFVPLAAQALQGSSVRLCVTAGYPLGSSLPQVKAYEITLSLATGAHEADVVPHAGALRIGDYVAVFEDITDAAHAAHERDALCRVMLDSSLLSDEEILATCQIARRAGADMVKLASTSAEAPLRTSLITWTREVIGDGMGLIAGDGITTTENVEAALRAGANRLATRAGGLLTREALRQNPG